MFLANEGSQIQSYYIPQLGIAPKWCTFLDNMTVNIILNFLINKYKIIIIIIAIIAIINNNR